VATSYQDEEQRDMNEGIEIENISHRLVTAKFGYNSKEDEYRNDLYHSFSNKHHLMNTDEKIFEDSFELD
jgi:bifunctional pyridoxal-dependent enzyme with beta-cystathionase and maltose regulon repressor activities